MFKPPLSIHVRGNDTGFYVEDADHRTIFDDGSACGEYSEVLSMENAQLIVDTLNKFIEKAAE